MKVRKYESVKAYWMNAMTNIYVKYFSYLKKTIDIYILKD